MRTWPEDHPKARLLERKQEAIQVAAKELFLRHGYADTTMEMVAAHAGVSIMTLYRHFRGKDVQVWAALPDGSKSWLLRIKDWDFNWQGSYQYSKPLALPKDTVVEMEYTYDNSENNPRNPSHPPVRVRWGEQTTDEMALAFLTVVLPKQVDAQQFQREILAQYAAGLLRRR